MKQEENYPHTAAPAYTGTNRAPLGLPLVIDHPTPSVGDTKLACTGGRNDKAGLV